ncbi:MAG: hypothetical protein K6F82_00255 [Sphaerochaetaceae bacterium]|nr:hypothetical protein [Sphaerochaetaceae bacterium]
MKNSVVSAGKNPHVVRTYVKVSTVFDTSGFMQPSSITWRDGRVFKIDSVRDFRPACTIKRGMNGDCYTIVVKGEEKLLFFERISEFFPSRFGRWFVESIKTEDG